MTEAAVVLRLTKHISTACWLCRKRNSQNEGFIYLKLSIFDKKASSSQDGFIIYCIDCYEMLRKMAAEDCKSFPPFYELVYEEQIAFSFPPELVCSTRDPFRLWRNKLDVESWLDKLAEERVSDLG